MTVSLHYRVGDADHFCSALLSLLDGQVLDLDTELIPAETVDLCEVYIVFFRLLNHLLGEECCCLTIVVFLVASRGLRGLGWLTDLEE